MNLLRYRPISKDLKLPNGALVKLTVNEIATGQEVADQYDRVHATARPDPILWKLRGERPSARSFRARLGRLRADLRPTPGRKRWAKDEDLRLWTPLPDDVTALSRRNP